MPYNLYQQVISHYVDYLKITIYRKNIYILYLVNIIKQFSLTLGLDPLPTRNFKK